MSLSDPYLICTNFSIRELTHRIPRFKQRFAFIVPSIGVGHELAALDCLKVCNTTLFLVSANTDEEDIFDKWGKQFVNMAVAQGVPTPIISLMDLESVSPNRRGKVKADVQKFIHRPFPAEKLMSLDTNSDAFNLFRRIGGQKKNVLHNKDNRPHLYAENVEYVESGAGENLGTLKVTGHLRGISFDVNSLVHIAGMGDFQMSQIDLVDDPFRSEKDREPGQARTSRVLARADPSKQTSLQRENIPDEMDAEQTWPTEEEIAHAQAETKKMRLVKRVPKGMSDYQAAWIPDIEERENSDEDNDDDEDMSEEDGEDDDEDFMSCNSNPNSDDEFEKPEDDANEYESVVVNEGQVNEDKYDLDMDMQEENETWQKLKEARSDQLWPDEIDTPLDLPAHVRFQRYRGLESFRTSPWDVKENLPADYARIFQFQNFERTKRRILKEYKKEVDGVQPGWYITVYVDKVPLSQWKSWQSIQDKNPVLIVYGLLPHENQMSVLNAVLKRAPGSEIPIKSKERLIFQCGYRRFIVNPIFSQHTNSDRHKVSANFLTSMHVTLYFFCFLVRTLFPT